MLALTAFCVKLVISEDVNEIVEAISNGNYFVIAFGFILPVTVPVIYLFIRGRRMYSPPTVMEFIHVSMPFAVHLSVSTLLSLSVITHNPTADTVSLNVGNLTTTISNTTTLADQLVESARLVTASDVATPILVIVTIYALFFAIQTTLLYSIADFMAPAAIVMAWKHFAETHDTDSASVVILIAGTAAFFVRIYMCCHDPDDYQSVLYTAEAESDAHAHEMQQVKLQVLPICQDDNSEV